jgi:hypothetical protein
MLIRTSRAKNPILFLACFFVLFFLMVHHGEASTISGLLDSGVGESGLDDAYIQKGNAELIMSIILRTLQFLLTFIGVAFMVYATYAGFLWLTAAGNDDKSKKAKGILTQAVIGIAVILLSLMILYTITRFIENTVGA